MMAHNGLCLVHRAEIMQLEGAWGEALAEARRASEHFTRGVLNELARGKALYRQGELHRLRGELAAAEESYRAASKCGYEPQPGLALLRLAEGNAVEAGRAMRRLLAETDQPLTRSRLLPAHVEIMLAIGDIEEARRSCSNLEEIAEAHASEMLAALAAEARAAVASAQGDPHAALADLRRAFAVWHDLPAPYEAACVRVAIGLACRSLRDEETAVLELEAAREIFMLLAARPDLAPGRRVPPQACDARPVRTDRARNCRF
jgi:tetratricopeptide (TPR) repeat protein